MAISTEMTLEQAIQHAKNQAEVLADTPCGLQHAQLAGWLSELLAVREAQSKPVLFANKFDFENGGDHTDTVTKMRDGYTVPLYTAQPALALPGELLDAMAEVIRISDRDHEAWDRAKAAISACRAAMLQPVSQGYTFDGLNIRAVAALRSACSDQWLNSEVFADKVHWQNMHSIANEIMEAMAAPTLTKDGE